ncbi:MAG: single-stranded DNA-binding protein [Anaerolineaceae bacterium]|nr:single-stranded DNA-binding protein [Anaerolineaceae bacterium]
MFQTIIIIGNLGRDPEMRYLSNGKAVTSFSLASNRTYKSNDGQQVKETTWFRITVWGNQAESCNQYLKKGGKVLVEGRLTPDSETGSPKVFQRKDGTWGASYEVNAQTVRFLSSIGESNDQGEELDDGGDIPF